MAKYGPVDFKLKDGRSIVIRHCKPEDVELFADFQNSIASETTNTLQVAGKSPPKDKVRENWLMCQEDKRYLKLGAFDGKRLIGQLGIHPIYADHPWTHHVAGFAMMIIKNYWGHGLGKKLLHIMEAFAKEAGYSRIEAKVRLNNKRAIKLYTNEAYTLEGTRYNAALINGKYESEYYLAKILEEKALAQSWQPPELKTERLLLRPLVASDADSIYNYARNPNVSKYTLWEPHKDRTDSLDFIVNYAHAHYRKKTPEPFGICLKENPDKVIGSIGCFWVSKPSKSIELAYALAEPYWGKGLTIEASKAVMSYCFKSMDVHRIQARCKIENAASKRVLEKLGMQWEGTLKSAVFHRDRFWDMHYYSILKDQ